MSIYKKVPSLSSDIQNCPLCDSTAKNLFSEFPVSEITLSYWECHSCSLVFQSPQMTNEVLAEFYANEYRKHLYGQAEPPQIDIEIQEKRSKHISGIIREVCGDMRNKVHLDIGCGNGALVNKIQTDHRSESYGIEPDRAYREYALEHGVRCYASLGDWSKDVGTKVWLVTLAHVLEHLSNPLQYLSEIRENLIDPEGYILIEVPNLYFHQSFELAHNFAFTFHTLSNLLHAAGFELVYLKKHGFPLKKTPRYLTILAQPRVKLEMYPPTIKEFPGIRLRRFLGTGISRVEDLVARYVRKIRRRVFHS